MGPIYSKTYVPEHVTEDYRIKLDNDETFKLVLREFFDKEILKETKKREAEIEEKGLEEPLSLVKLDLLFGDKNESKTMMKVFRRAQVKTLKKIMKHDFFVKNVKSSVDVKQKRDQVIENMKKVNDLNWQYFISHFNKKKKKTPMNDFDSCLIRRLMKRI